MKVSKEDIEKLAELSHLRLSNAEVETYHEQLQGMFAIINKVNEVDTTNVPETFHVSGATAVPRDDEPNYTFEKSDMIASMPETDEDGYMKVKAVLNQTTESPE